MPYVQSAIIHALASMQQNHLIKKSSQCQCEEQAPQLKQRSIAQLPTAAEQEDLDYHAKFTVSNEGGLNVLTMSRVLKHDAPVSAV